MVKNTAPSRKKIGGFTIVPHSILTDPTLSAAVLRVLLYMLFRPRNWVFYKSDIAKKCRLGLGSVAGALQKLHRAGYIGLTQAVDEQGRTAERWKILIDTENLTKGFTMVPNAILLDALLSHTGMRVLIYMLSKPKGWKYYKNDIAKNCAVSIRTVSGT